MIYFRSVRIEFLSCNLNRMSRQIRRIDVIVKSYLVGAGLADPDGVLGLEMVLPKADNPAFPFTLVIVEPTDKRDGRGVVVVDDVLPSLRCGIRDGVVSSTLKTKKK